MRRFVSRRPRLPQQAFVAPPGKRTSIAARLRWSYLLSSTLPLLIVGALLLGISAQTQQASVYNDQQNLARRTSRSIASYTGDLYRQIDEYAINVRPGSTLPNQWQRDALALQSRRYPNMIRLAVLDTAGRELFRADNLQLVSEDRLAEYGNDPAVQQALNQRTVSFSSIQVSQAGQRTFILTRPLLSDAGAVIGAIRAEISAEPVIEELEFSTAGSDSYAYLVAPDGTPVLVDDGSPGFEPIPQLSALSVTQAATAEYRGALNQDVIGAVEPVVLSGNNVSVGWSVVVEQPSAIAFASVRRSILILALLVILVGALALLWAFRHAQQILRPLHALRDGAVAFGSGQLDYRILPPGSDELGDLARTFNQMADRLQHSLAEIEDQNDRLRHGLALARDIQVGLLPDRVPWNNDMMDVYARSIPAYEVGGDFYTYLALAEGRAAIAIGDISGKGVGAALLMALTSSAVESQGRQLEYPAEVLTALNQLLAPRLRANHMNAALLFAVFDPQERLVRVANAGMIAPVMITPTGNYFVEVGGLPVGAFPGAVYQEQTVQLNPGDALLLVSDGVVEAHNAEGELFGFERLEAAVAEAQPPGDVRALVELVIERVQHFMGNAEQHDDITLVAVRPAVAADMPLPTDEEQSVRYATV